MTARAAFLRALPGCGFAPPAADVAALGGGLPAGAAADRFAAGVRAFAAEFWALPPAARRARWEALTARAAGPAAAWLAELGDAVDVTPAAHADPAAAEVASVVRELTVLWGRARAERRRAWLADAPDRFAARRQAAPRVIRGDPPLARLEPLLFDYLAVGVRPRAAGTPGAMGTLLRRLWRGARRLALVVTSLAASWVALMAMDDLRVPVCCMVPLLPVCCYVVWQAMRK